jgi:hypothetical protein
MRGSAKYRRLLAIGLILGSLQVFAQERTDTTQGVGAVPDQNEVQDESWSYLGQRLFYQFKKRMNLTTQEEDVEEENEGKKAVRIRILGMEIERNRKEDS